LAKEWVISAPWPGREEMAGRLGVSPVLAQVLHNRGIEADAAGAFLRPQMSGLHGPALLGGALAAAARIAAAVRSGERIVIFGDYDVDGITGVSILWHCLTLAEANVDFYIPHRLEEGYGISAEAIDALADDGAKLVISVDCGITAMAPALRARQRGIELIITDHHEPQRDASGAVEIPEAMVVHPGLGDGAGYPNRDLCGAGVALKLAWAVAQELSGSERVSPAFRAFLVEAMGLAALGTVADIVPLVGENRIIARYGLLGLPESKLHGIRALIGSAGLTGKALGGFDVGFKLGPRLNAIGRMGHARLAVEMLTRAGAEEAVRIASNLEQQNRARQALERRIAQEAREMVIAERQHEDHVRGIVLASEGWHAGVIGIVASRIVGEFHKPAVMIALENGTGQGSARSIRHFPLHAALAECGEHLLAYGGHAMAAGLKIAADKVDAFREAFWARAGQRLTAADLRPRLEIDDEVGLDALDEGLVKELARLEPCGAGNPAATFCSDWLEVVGDPRAVGASGAHLQVRLGDGRRQIKGIAFGQAKHAAALGTHRRCRVAFRPSINEWNGRRSVEMQVLDFQFPEN